MNNFNVSLNVKDSIISKCTRDVSSTDTTVTSTSQSINIGNSYQINVVYATNTYVTVIIQNGTYVYIRNIYTNYTSSICLPSNDCCTKQIVCIGVNSITLDE